MDAILGDVGKIWKQGGGQGGQGGGGACKLLMTMLCDDANLALVRKV